MVRVRAVGLIKYKHIALVLAASSASIASSTRAQVTSVDLSNYQRIARYPLPEPTTVTPPDEFSLLAQEASGVTYDKDTDSLFVVGDGGRSIVQVTKTGVLINSMTLAPGSSDQGTDFYDPEGITYVGNGKFVFTEERDQRANLVTYVPSVGGASISHGAAQTVTLGAFVGNVGLEGLTRDLYSGGYVFVKEKTPLGIFQTDIDFNAATFTHGSVPASNMFDPTLLGLADFADVYSLSTLSSMIGHPDESHLLVLSQESGKIVETDRLGNILSSLTITNDPGDIAVDSMQHEGMTMDDNGFLYTVCENGGGDINHPQLWVYAPVPEPTTPAILVAGLGLFGAARRRGRPASTSVRSCR